MFDSGGVNSPFLDFLIAMVTRQISAPLTLSVVQRLTPGETTQLTELIQISCCETSSSEIFVSG